MITNETKKAIDIIMSHTDTTEDMNAIIDAVKRKRKTISSKAGLQFNIGDKVHWESRKRGLGFMSGVITKLNRISATVKVGEYESWKVAYSFLRAGEAS